MKKLNLILICCFLLPFGISAKQIDCQGYGRTKDRAFSFKEILNSNETITFTKEITFPDSSKPDFEFLIHIDNFLLVNIHMFDFENGVSLGAFSPLKKRTPYLSLMTTDRNGDSWHLLCEISEDGSGNDPEM